jgi:hypothetical protein
MFINKLIHRSTKWTDWVRFFPFIYCLSEKFVTVPTFNIFGLDLTFFEII